MSVKFITRNFEVVTLALGLLKKTHGHAADDVAQSVQAMIKIALMLTSIWLALPVEVTPLHQQDKFLSYYEQIKMTAECT